MSKMTVRHTERYEGGREVVRFFEVDDIVSTTMKVPTGEKVLPGDDVDYFDSVFSNDGVGHICHGHVMLLNSSGVKIWERGFSK